MRKMKVGDKLKFVGDKPIHSWIAEHIVPGSVVEVVDVGRGHANGFRPGNYWSKDAALCVGTWDCEYDLNGLLDCKAWKVIN